MVPAPNLTQRVRRVVGALLAAHGTPDLHAVAGVVDVSVRTLQRRLREAGVSYAQVLAEARFEAARRMLRESDVRIGEVARTLGYSDGAHFTRAFQRWTGVTPRDFRRGAAG